MAMPYASLSPAADHRASPVLPFCRSSPLSSSVGEEAPMSGRWRPPFTAAQYEELEQQALIYKHLVAGVPVPPDLLLPIHRSIDTLTARYYLHPTIGYGSYFGKKLDPEPGRCRRTDGKKWRCSKEAAPDSKYCERHMHRGRNRSRKPVETQLIPHSQSPATNPPAAAAAAAVPTPVPAATPANGGCFHNHSLYPAISSGGNVSGSFTLLSPQLHMDNGVTAAAGGSKDLRYTAYGVNSLVDECNQLTAGAIDTTIDSSWRLLPSQTSLFALPSYTPLMALNDLGQNTISSLPKVERQPLPFFESDFGTIVNSAKQENQTLRPFFDEWPKARDS